jgi:hypothetical protein
MDLKTTVVRRKSNKRKRVIMETTSMEVCTICLCDLDSQQPQCVLQCTHTFHTSCIQRWLLDHVTCPICRSEEIACQHGSMVDHDRETLQMLLHAQRDSIQQGIMRENELRDHVMALEIVNQNAIQNLTFHSVRILFGDFP